MEQNEASIYLRYRGFKDHSQVDLSQLGISLLGFDQLFRKLIKVTRINGDVQLKVTSFKPGSIDVETIIKILQYPDHLPFDRVNHLLEFLKVASDIVWQDACSFFKGIAVTYEELEAYFARHPLQVAFLVAAIIKFIDRCKNLKQPRDLINSEFPKGIAISLHRLIHSHGFKRALRPIIEDEAISIEISNDVQSSERVVIDQNNFHNYLGKDDEVLPYLENGCAYCLLGEIRSLKSTVGDSLTFRLINNGKTYNLDLIPPEGISTKHYTEFYKELVTIEAEVIRTSLYKKPKLKLISMDFQQRRITGLDDPIIPGLANIFSQSLTPTLSGTTSRFPSGLPGIRGIQLWSPASDDTNSAVGPSSPDADRSEPDE